MSHVYKPSVSADFGPVCYILKGKERPNPIYDRGSVSRENAPHSLLNKGSVKSKGYSPNYKYYEGVVVSKGYSPKPISYRGSNSACVASLDESKAYRPNVYTVTGSVSAPRLNTTEASVFAENGLKSVLVGPSVYQGFLPRLLLVVGTRSSAQIGPNSLVTETVGCLFEATGSYGDSEPVSSTSQSLGQAAGTTKEDLNHVHFI